MQKNDFIWVACDNFHKKRQKQILASHPSVKCCYGYEWKSKWITLALVIIYVFSALVCPALNTIPYILCVYVIGATLAQALFLAIHELTHNLFFSSPVQNKLFAIFVNLPLLIPFAIPFREYHLKHHSNLGVDGKDVDLPSKREALLTRNMSAKVVWCAFQLVIYAVRPLFVFSPRLTCWGVGSLCAQILFDILCVHVWGWGPVRFILLSMFLSGGLHPCAGHFFSEHFARVPYQETYSYYGGLNYLTWNVGYHVEHHDFPNVPWSRLPCIRTLAAPYYDSLLSCPSWTWNIIYFIREGDLFSRIKRTLCSGSTQ